jgi:nitric oxide reductase large subunit
VGRFWQIHVPPPLFHGRRPEVLALGATFSAFEVVPLALIGFEAWENIRLSRTRHAVGWLAAYKWPIYFFVAVAFWNFVGAGLFGFFINPPVALYYMQGLSTTPVHGHRRCSWCTECWGSASCCSVCAPRGRVPRGRIVR